MLLSLSIFLICCSMLPSIKPSDSCLPHFPDQDGWYGADGAYSIQLDERRTLWLFGDTFASEDERRKDRIGMDVVMGNTLAVSTCSDDQRFSIRYFLKKKNGKFISSFGENDWLWPQDPFIAGRMLYIPFLVIEAIPHAPQPFNFKVAGHKVARIKDYEALDPREWAVDYLDWTHAIPEGVQALATTSIVHQGHIYFFPLYRHKKDNLNMSGNILARIPLSNLNHPEMSMQYLNRDGMWENKLTPETIKIILGAAVSELSVRYHPENNHWMAVYLSPDDKGRRLLYQTAPGLEGPWSAPVPLITSIDEVDPASRLYDKHTFCYAGKEHRQFARANELVVTYVCNSSDSDNKTTGFLYTNLFLYRPVVKIINVH